MVNGAEGRVFGRKMKWWRKTRSRLRSCVLDERRWLSLPAIKMIEVVLLWPKHGSVLRIGSTILDTTETITDVTERKM